MANDDRDLEALVTLGLSRRSVLKSVPVVAIGAGLGLSLSGCAGAAIPASTVVFGPPDDLELGTPRRLTGYDVYLIRSEQGIAAISGRCTHAGCPVSPVETGFHCGCHGSEFSADGTVTHGPAQTDLQWFAVRIEDGNVVVDPTEEVGKGSFTPVGGEEPAPVPVEEPTAGGEEEGES